jgi:hypothetical protein
MPSDAQLKTQLRTVLRADAVDHPLPDDLLRIPDRWVRPGISRAALRVVATAVSAIVLVAAAALFLRATNVSIGGPSTADIADAIGVPSGQVLATQDGWVAVRRAGNVLEVLAVRRAGEQILSKVVGSTGIPQAGASAAASSVIAGDSVSCSAADALHEPYIVYAFSAFGADGPIGWSVSPEASRIATSGEFLVAVFAREARPNTIAVNAQFSDENVVNSLGLTLTGSTTCVP